MSHPTLTDQQVSLSKVWIHLAPDCQRRAIHFMADLVFKLIARQIDTSRKEVTHVIPSQHTKNPV